MSKIQTKTVYIALGNLILTIFFKKLKKFPKTKTKHKINTIIVLAMGWWRNPESNWGHKDFQSSALPTELFRRSHGKTKCDFKTNEALLVNRERFERNFLKD